MTVENISLTISTKVWDRATIEVMTPGSAIGLTPHCAMRPGHIAVYTCQLVPYAGYQLNEGV